MEGQSCSHAGRYCGAASVPFLGPRLRPSVGCLVAFEFDDEVAAVDLPGPVDQYAADYPTGR